ncbi:MAG: hypothetical protein ABI343_22490, partial [Burkholderiaceae bacterium]
PDFIPRPKGGAAEWGMRREFRAAASVIDHGMRLAYGCKEAVVTSSPARATGVIRQKEAP